MTRTRIQRAVAAARHRRGHIPPKFATAILVLSLGVGTLVGLTASAFSGQTSNSGNTFQAAASFGCNGDSTPVFLTGLEHGAVSTAGGGLFDLIATAGGSPTIDSVVKRNGGYSLKIAKSSAGESYVAKALSPAAGVVAVRFAIRLATLPSASVVQLLGISATAGSSLDFGYSAATQKFTVNLTLDGAPATNASSTVVAGTWYVVDLKFDAASNPRTVAWRIDGVAQTGVSQSTTGSTATYVYPGSNTTADVFTANYDDLLVSATAADYPIGDGKVLALRPTGMGTHVNPQYFANNGGSAIDATTYTRLDDDPMTSSFSYIYQGTLSASSYVELTMADTSESCFNGVSAVLAYNTFSTSSATAKTSVFNGAAENVVFSGNMASTTLTYKSAIVSSAAQWTQSEVNGLVARMGYFSAGPGTPVWHALVLEYDVPS